MLKILLDKGEVNLNNTTILTSARSPTDINLNKNIKPLRKEDIKASVSQLLNERTQYVVRWKSIRDYQLPFLGCFDGEETAHHQRRDSKVTTGTCWESNITFASGIMSGLTPPSRQWFKLAIKNEELRDNIDVSSILDERQKIMYTYLSRSNFYNAVQQVYLELAFGQAPLAVFSDSQKGLRYVSFPIGSYCFDVGANGLPNTFLYKYRMSNSQLKEQFGLENLPKAIQYDLQNGKSANTKQDVFFYVDRNPNYIQGSINSANMPFRALYWCDKSEENEWLHVGGFQEFPVLIARYLVNGLNPYGMGAGWFAEGDAKMLQAMNKEKLINVQMVNRPPMQSTAALSANGINILPGAINPIKDDANGGIRPIVEVKSNIGEIREEIREVKESIKRIYAADLFMMLDQIEKGQMTAREVMERAQEKLQQLAPIVERVQFEFLNPLLERTYNILERANAFPEFPPEALEALDGEEIEIEYTSPLAQAQKMAGLTAVEQALAFVTSMLQIYPEVRHKINAFEMVDSYLEALGAPAKIRISTDKAQEKLNEEQKMLEQQQQAELAMAAAKPASDYSNAARNINEVVGQGQSSGLANLLGGM